MAILLLGLFCIAGTLTMMVGQRKRYVPVGLARLMALSISLAFEVLPLAAVSMLAGHHPRSLADPSWYSLWLSGYDAETGHLSSWNELIGPAVSAGESIRGPVDSPA